MDYGWVARHRESLLQREKDGHSLQFYSLGPFAFSLTNFMIRIYRIVFSDLASAGAFAVDRSANQIFYAEVFGVANVCHFFP